MEQTPTLSSIRIGPAGWSYPDWEGRVYPTPAPRGLDRLAYLARFFDLVEVNASFYRVPSARTAESWVARVAGRPGFQFTAKLHRSLTHEGTLDAGVVAAMLDFVRPLEQAGLLGALLAQFPWSFRPQAPAYDSLARLREALGQRVVALEVRHGGWADPDAQRRVADMGYALVSVDQPQVGDCLPPMAVRTADVAYVRLHGRNRAAWFARDAGRDARYDYLYGEAELAEWAQRIVPLAERARATYVVTNNHFEGKAIANALQLQALLGLAVDEVPAPLARAYPGVMASLRRGDRNAAVEVEAAGGSPPLDRPAAAQGELFP